MASRIIHYMLSCRLLEEYPCLNGSRFRFGCVMPDAGPITQTHFLLNVCDETKRIHDLTGFRRQYGQKMIEDDLYLGYYMHLLQDQIFRYYVFEMIGFDPVPAGNIDALHHDYELLNPYVIGKYEIKNTLSVPEEIEQEVIFKTADFEIDRFMKDFNADFTRKPAGSNRFFTAEMTDAYIRKTEEICRQEMQAVFAGTGYFDEYRYAWHRHRR